MPSLAIVERAHLAGVKQLQGQGHIVTLKPRSPSRWSSNLQRGIVDKEKKWPEQSLATSSRVRRVFE